MFIRAIAIAIFISGLLFCHEAQAEDLFGSVITLSLEKKISAAVVTLFNLTGTPVATAQTDPNGRFHLPNLNVGEYVLQVSAEGFSADVAGQQGELAARFKARAQNYGFYFENQLDLSNSFTLSAGGRFDSAHRHFEDLFLADGDRSDERTFSAFSPKIGLLWKHSDDTVVFGNISRSYEPPLLLELTSFGAPEFLNLEAQSTWQFEIGSRGRLGRTAWDVAFYDAEIDNEIINVNIHELYSGSVQVDNAAGRYFEPSNGRSIYAGIQWEL
jgi:outer membrane receptor protein involved in Fe transport